MDTIISNGNIIYTPITLEQMLTQEVIDIIRHYQFGYSDYYWKNGDGELVKITKLDLLSGRFYTEDGDFSEFEWELKESSIYQVTHYRS